MTDDCKTGVHAMEIIAGATVSGEGWIAMAEGATEVEYCAKGNLATMGLFFHKVGTITQEAASKLRSIDCPTCKAHSEAVAAGMAAYKEVMSKARFQIGKTCH